VRCKFLKQYNHKLCHTNYRESVVKYLDSIQKKNKEESIGSVRGVFTGRGKNYHFAKGYCAESDPQIHEIGEMNI